ncbi:MAG: pitrilysin family protein [Candidatus Micrarchaeota archaeon]
MEKHDIFSSPSMAPKIDRYMRAVRGEIRLLENGIPVLFEYNPNSFTACVSMWRRTGSGDEPVRYAGLSHFGEHMVFRGANGLTSYATAELIEGVGGTFNAFTDREQVAYHATVLREHAPIAVEVLSKIVTAPRFPARELDIERRIVLGEFNTTRDVPKDYSQDIVFGLMWPSSFGRTELGLKSVVQNVDRQTFLDFHMAQWQPKNLFVVVTGNFDKRAVLRTLNSTLGKLSNNGKVAKQDTLEMCSGRKHVRDSLAAFHITIAAHAPPFGEDYMNTTAVDFLLGGGSNSRLSRRVRDKEGLAYTIETEHTPYTKASAITIYSDPPPELAVFTLHVIMDELRKLSRKEPYQTEMRRVLNQIEIELLEKLDVESRMGRIGRWFMATGRLVSTQELIAMARKVTAADVTATARKIFSEGISLVTMGRMKDGERIRQSDLEL